MTIWRVFSPEYGGNVEIVGLKVWLLLKIIERQWHENIEGKMKKNSKKEDKKAKVKKSNKSRLNSLLLL